jgi:hypothetical protein
LALAGLFLGQAAVNALRSLILWFDVAAEIGPINFAFRGERYLALFGLDRFPQFVGKHKGCFIGNSDRGRAVGRYNL